MIKQLKLSTLTAMLLVSVSAFAAKTGYVADQSTDSVVRNSYNECWRNGTFDKAQDGLVECGDREVATEAIIVPQRQESGTPMVPQKEKITIAAEVLFDFDTAVLRPDAEKILEPVAQKLRDNAGTSFVRSVEITGRTDYLGSDEYNDALSQQRADAVKAYFVNVGIPASKIDAIGKGKSETKMTEMCKAKFKPKTHRKQLIKCLAPDRNVQFNIDVIKETTAEPAR